MRERVVLDVARGVAQRLELGQAARHLAPARDEVDLDEVRAPSAAAASASAALAFSLKRGEVAMWRHGRRSASMRLLARSARRSPARPSCRPAPRRRGAPRSSLALALQLAGHVHQAAEIAGEQQAGAGRRDVRRLLGDDGVGDVGILDAERAAEAAADVGVAHLGEREARRRVREQLCAAAPARRARAGPSRNRDRSPSPSKRGVDARHPAARRPGSDTSS